MHFYCHSDSNHRRNNALNWVNQTKPSAGSIVSFPSSFSDFYLEECTSSNQDECQQGGVVSIKANEGQALAAIELATLILPRNGEIRLTSSNTVITFIAANATVNETYVQWLDRGKKQFDFNCAANWVLQGTTENPDFTVPCAEDTATFLAV